jgi:small conductance mechanosensitive channel
VGTPLRIGFIVGVGLLLRYVLHRIIDRTAERIARGQAGLGKLDDRLPSATAIFASPLASARRAQRSRTLASVLKSVTTGFLGVIVGLLVCGELGINLGPLIAGAGIAGVALGFGAQTLVKDFLSGIFMVIEDQYGVGDVVDLGEAIGTVEAVGLRVTRLRDIDGTVWYVRNGEVLRVGNRSQGWARALIDLQVPYGQDLDRVKEIMLEVAAELREDPDLGPLLLDDPGVWAIEAMGPDAVGVRLIVKTQPLKQWDVAVELRSRLVTRLDAEGIRIALPYRLVPGPPGGETGQAAGDARAT